MINYGIFIGGFFLCVGILYECCHIWFIEDYGGIVKQMLCFVIFFMIMILVSIGFFGINGFVGEFLILVGMF